MDSHPLPRVAAKASLLALLALAGCGDPEDTEPADECASPLSLDASSHLRTDATRLVDPEGRIVLLRGVNAGGRTKIPPFVPFDFAAKNFDEALATYLDRARDWGFDVLRVPFTWEAVEPSPGQDDEEFLKRYDALLDAAWARGMLTIVDFHQDIYAAIFCGDGFPAWTVPGPHDEPHHDCENWGGKYLSDGDVRGAFDAFWAEGSTVRAGYEALWDRMVERHKDRPGVIGFELFNEPSPGSAVVETWAKTTLTPFYSAMAKRVHDAAPDALVLFDASGVDAVTVSTSVDRPEGDGLVFAPHYYQYNALAGSQPNVGGVEFDLQKWQSYGSKWSVPVLLGEFGASNTAPDVPAYLRAHYDALDLLGMHSTQWEYSASSELWNFEDLSLVAADGKENPVVSAVVRPYPRAVAGAGVAFSYDADARVALLGYTPGDKGVTDIAVPDRIYEAGYDVTISGACFDASHPGRLLVKANEGSGSVSVRIAPR